jgi:hypothetical protein
MRFLILLSVIIGFIFAAAVPSVMVKNDSLANLKRDKRQFGGFGGFGGGKHLKDFSLFSNE